jgi:hypothetical protein
MGLRMKSHFVILKWVNSLTKLPQRRAGSKCQWLKRFAHSERRLECQCFSNPQHRAGSPDETAFTDRSNQVGTKQRYCTAKGEDQGIIGHLIANAENRRTGAEPISANFGEMQGR